MHPAGTQKTVGTHELSLRVVGTTDAVVGEQRPRLLLAGLAKARLAGGDFGAAGPGFQDLAFGVLSQLSTALAAGAGLGLRPLLIGINVPHNRWIGSVTAPF